MITPLDIGGTSWMCWWNSLLSKHVRCVYMCVNSVVNCSGLDLTGMVHSRDDPQPLYDLFAVSNHFGGMGGGHC